jgi:hypothetical protein
LELIRFKTKWGSMPKPLYRYYYPVPRPAIRAELPPCLRHVTVAFWRHVPLRATAYIGEIINSYL